MEVITDADYAHAKRICKDLKNIYIFIDMRKLITNT